MSEEQAQASFEGWAVLEIFGHQRYAGYVTTQAFGQSVLFRVDVPPLAERDRELKCYEYVDGVSVPPGSKVKESSVQGYTKFFGPGAIYAMTPCSQAAALKAVEGLQSRKMSVIELAPARPGIGAAASTADADEADVEDESEVLD